MAGCQDNRGRVWRGKVDFGDAIMAPSIVNSADLESYSQPESVQRDEA